MVEEREPGAVGQAVRNLLDRLDGVEKAAALLAERLALYLRPAPGGVDTASANEAVRVCEMAALVADAEARVRHLSHHLVDLTERFEG